MDKLHVIVRADLPPGLLLAQAVHAMSAFAVYQPAEHRAWHLGKNIIACVTVPDRAALEARLARATMLGEVVVGYHEEDLAGELTAVVLGARLKKLVRDLPLAFSVQSGVD